MTRNQNNNKKQNTTNKSRNNTGNNSGKKRLTPKPKVYIAPYKIIILCASIITICMLLLLATSIMSKPESSSMASRYNEEKTLEQEIKEPVIEKKADNKAKPEAKKAPVTKKDSPTKKTVEKAVEKTVEKEPVKEKKAAVPVPAPVVEKQEKPATVPAPAPKKADFGFPAAQNGAQLIFVFDDGGHNINQAKAFLDLPFPYTVAVLPRLKASKETADLIRNSGNEVILHQPMQAVNLSVDPGEGAIKPDMSESEIRSTLFQNVTEIAPIAGMNNHEGSAITANPEQMAAVLKFCSSEGIFFLDSRTNAETAVPYVAKELGYSYYERNVFLDNEKTRENILTELRKGLDIANKKGSCIMIGHIWSADILPKVLLEVYPELKEKGYTFSVVSKSKARIYN